LISFARPRKSSPAPERDNFSVSRIKAAAYVFWGHTNMRRLSRNPSQNLEFSLWRRVIAATGGFGQAFLVIRGPPIAFIPCNLASTCALVALRIVKLCKGRVTAAPTLGAAMDRSCDPLPEIEQIVFAALPCSGVASP
jgi:hypothetical protein